MLQGLFFFFIIAALSSAQQKCPQRRSCHFLMQTDSGRFLRPLSLSKGRRTAKNRRHFPIRKKWQGGHFLWAFRGSGFRLHCSTAFRNAAGRFAPCAPTIPAVLALANGVFAENSRAGSACHNPCRALICHLQPPNL